MLVTGTGNDQFLYGFFQVSNSRSVLRPLGSSVVSRTRQEEVHIHSVVMGSAT